MTPIPRRDRGVACCACLHPVQEARECCGLSKGDAMSCGCRPEGARAFRVRIRSQSSTADVMGCRPLSTIFDTDPRASLLTRERRPPLVHGMHPTGPRSPEDHDLAEAQSYPHGRAHGHRLFHRPGVELVRAGELFPLFFFTAAVARYLTRAERYVPCKNIALSPGKPHCSRWLLPCSSGRD
jgi:hypothetical protein